MRGELDVATADMLTERLRHLRDHSEPVLLDLDELEFIDMRGLRVVLRAAGEAAREGLPFTVTPGSVPVRRLFGLVQPEGRLTFDGDSP